jgi:hypothetical protein
VESDTGAFAVDRESWGCCCLPFCAFSSEGLSGDGSARIPSTYTVLRVSLYLSLSQETFRLTIFLEAARRFLCIG